MTVYYDTKTGNVKRFIDQLKTINPTWNFININDQEHFTEKGHLITYTWARGSVPVTTNYFTQRYADLILSVSSSGNRNWGTTFGNAADEISKNLGCPLVHKFELSGLKQDVNIISNSIKMIESRMKRKHPKISL